ADLGLLADALRHGIVPVQTEAPDPAGDLVQFLRPYRAPRRLASGKWRWARLFCTPTFLFYTVPAIDTGQCRVPPSPPAIRDMKKPGQRKSRGLRIQTSRSINGR